METLHEPERLWPHIPHGLTFCGDANAVAVDSQDYVYVFNRGPIPVLIFEPDGTYVGGWGTGDFDRPHSIYITDDDTVWLIDSGSHFVQKRDLSGKVLMTLGERGRGAPAYSGEPFNGPTDIAVHGPTGDVFISDGYGNSHIHKYTSQGEHVMTWGGTGDGPGELSNPHGICLLGDETLVVCDRENYRLQFFTLEGELVEQWHSFMPCAIRTRTGDPNLYLAQLPPPAKYLHVMTSLGRCVQVLSPSGEVLERFGGPDELLAPHGLAIDSQRSIYIAEVNKTYLEFLGDPIEAGIEPVSLRKWKCTAAEA